MQKKIIALLPSVLWALLVLKLTLTAPNRLPRFPWVAEWHLDKVVHLGLFGIQTWLLLWGLQRSNSQVISVKIIVICGLTVIAFSIGIEFIQPFFGRSFDHYDIVANSSGCVLAGILFNKKNNI